MLTGNRFQAESNEVIFIIVNKLHSMFGINTVGQGPAPDTYHIVAYRCDTLYFGEHVQ